MTPYHFPEQSPDGPWGVGDKGGHWYVVHKVNGRSKRIGRIIGFGKTSERRPNYFERALEEAARRNSMEKARDLRLLAVAPRLLKIAHDLTLATDEGDDAARGTHYIDADGVIRCKGSFLDLIERARSATHDAGEAS